MAEHNFQEPIYPPLNWKLPERRAPGLPERDRFPVDPERRQRSAESLHELRQKHPERVDGRSYPWRAMLFPATGLPATLRTWADAPFYLDDEGAQREAREVLAVDQRSLALFGEAKGDNFKDDFDPAPIIKVQINPEQGDGSVMRHFAWRQVYRGLPVLGGGVRCHEVTRDQRLCLTNSYFPVADAPPDLNPRTSTVDCAWFALLSLLESSAVSPETMLAIMVPRFFEERRGQEATNFLDFLEPLLWGADLGSGELSELAHKALTAWHEHDRSNGVAVEELNRISTWLQERYHGVKFRAEIAPIQGSELAIMPWAGAYALTRRVQVTLPGPFSWYVDVDAQNGDVLGAPWQAVIGAPAFIASSADAATGVVTGDAASVDTTDLDAYVTMQDGASVVPLGASGSLPGGLSVDAATVIVHGQRLLLHLRDQCGADLTPPAVRLTVQARSARPEIEVAGFSTGSPGAVHFKSAPETGIAVGGKKVFHPARDPEVVMHEFAHAFLWLLNPDPWDVPTGPAPFSRALQEGYAMYLSRSLADQNGDNQDQHWGRGAYRPLNADGTKNWDDRWRLDRPTHAVGADLLPAPNVYPTGEYTLAVTLEDYDAGMVWARALWDLRTVLGPTVADKLAVRAYPYLHGYLTSFELAAEAFINADAQVSEMDLVNGTQPVWAARGIAAGQGVYGFAQAQDGTLIAAGDAGILRSDNGGAAWTLESANLASGGTLTGIVAVAADDDHLYAIAELPPPQAVGSDPQWNPGIYWRDQAQAGGLWQEVSGWPNEITPLCLLRVGAGQMLVGSNRGVYALTRNAANAHTLREPQVKTFAALHLAAVQQGQTPIVHAASPDGLRRSPLGPDGVPSSSAWPGSTTLFGGTGTTRLTAVATFGSTVLAGVIPLAAQAGGAVLLPDTFWQVSQPWSAATARGDLHQAVLALAANGANAWIATAEDVLQWAGGAAMTSLGLPINGAQVLSLAATATHLLAGTLAHGIWRRPIAGGAWEPQAAYAPPPAATVTVPAAGAALFSFLLDAAGPTFTINQATSPVQVAAVFQVGFPPGRVVAAGNNYNLQAGAVVVMLQNPANNAQTVRLDWNTPARLTLT